MFFKVGVLKSLQNHSKTAVLKSFLRTLIFFKESQTRFIYEIFKNTFSGCFCISTAKPILNLCKHTTLFQRLCPVIRCRATSYRHWNSVDVWIHYHPKACIKLTLAIFKNLTLLIGFFRNTSLIKAWYSKVTRNCNMIFSS